MSNFNFLKRLLPNKSPALANAERRALMEAEERAALIAEGKLIPTGPEVQGVGSSRARPDIVNIEDADTLSPKLHGANLPMNDQEKRMRQLKQLASLAGVGSAATLAVNLSDPMGNPQAVAQTPMDIAPQAEVAPEIEAPVAPKPTVKVPGKSTSSKEETVKEESLGQEIDFGDRTKASVDELADAQDRRDKVQLINRLGKAADIMGSGMSGTQAKFGGVFDDNIKAADGFVTNYQDKIKFEKEDPNSAMSKGYRDIAKSMGFNIKGQASAADLERLMPQLANIYNQKEAQASRKEIAEENRKARSEDKALARELAGMKNKNDRDLKDDTFAQSVRKEVTSGALGKMFSNYNTSKRMGAALDQFEKNPGAFKDYATLMGGLKVLQGDESVVREAEMRLGMNATSLANKVKNWSDMIITGKTLQPSQRKEMVESIRILSDVARTQYADAIEPHMQHAEKRGIDPRLILDKEILETRSRPMSVPSAPQGKTVIKKGYNPKTNQTQLIYADGSKEIVNGRR